MDKLENLVAIGLSIKEIISAIFGFFKTSISSDYYKTLDMLTFLNSKSLGFSSDGKLIDSTRIVGEAVCNLSSLVIWGVFIYYLFFSLFS